MDDKTQGTPNPLNPTPGITPLDANPSEPIRSVNQFNTTEPTRSVNQFNTTPPVNQFNTTPPSSPVVPMGVVENLDPTNRPMEYAPMPETPQPKKNKKKVGLIIGGMVCLFLAIGCGVAAILLFMNHGDPVERAMGKLMSGEAPTNTTIQGTIGVKSNDSSSSISDLKISINSNLTTDSLINSSTATLSGSLRNGGDFSIDLSEVYAANGDLYLKIDGISEIMDDPYLLSDSAETTSTEEGLTTEELQTEEEISVDEEMTLNEGTPSTGTITSMLSIIGTIDGEWIRIPISELGATSSELTSGIDSKTSCAVELFANLDNNRNSIMEMYQRNSFIGSTTKDLAVASVNNPIYKVVVKSENFTNFFNEARNSSMLKEYQDCTGETIEALNAGSVDQTLAELPEVYVEVDGDDNFTRLYFVADTNEGDATITTDLNFSYPTNVNVSEPAEYTDLSEILQGLFSNIYDTTGADVTVEE
jgi:hypothetical protein